MVLHWIILYFIGNVSRPVFVQGSVHLLSELPACAHSLQELVHMKPSCCPSYGVLHFSYCPSTDSEHIELIILQNPFVCWLLV